jgi:hypothetical protein
MRPKANEVTEIMSDVIEDRAKSLAYLDPSRPHDQCKDQALKEFKEYLRDHFVLWRFNHNL